MLRHSAAGGETSLTRIAMGDAFHRGGPRYAAYLELTATVHSRALRFRYVGSSAVLWAWLAGDRSRE